MKKIGKYIITLASIMSLVSCNKSSGNGEKPMGYEQFSKLASGYATRNYSIALDSIPQEYQTMTFDDGFSYGKMVKDGNTTLIDLRNMKPIVSGMKYSLSLGGKLKCFSDDRYAYIINTVGDVVAKLGTWAAKGTFFSISYGTGYYDYDSTTYFKAKAYNSASSEIIYIKHVSKGENAFYVSSNEEEFKKWQNYNASSLRSLRWNGFDTDNLYTGSFLESVSVYSPKKEYIGSIPFASLDGNGCEKVYGSNGTYYLIGLKSEKEVVDSVLLDTVNTYCFVIDFEKASWEYVDHLPWRLVEAIGYTGGSYLLVQPLNDTRTNVLPYFQVFDVKNNIMRPDVYDYDPLIFSKWVKAGKDTLLSIGAEEAYSVNKKGRYPVAGIDTVNYYNEDEILYRNDENKMVLGNTAIIAKNRSVDLDAKGYDSISWDKYNGVHIFSNTVDGVTTVNDKYKVANNNQLYFNGLIVGDNSVAPIGLEGKTYSSKISNATHIANDNGIGILKVSLENGTSEIVKITRTLN